MALTPARPLAPRKRTRKRKRRAVSSSESSSSEDSSSSSEAPNQAVFRLPVKAAKKPQPEHSEASSSSSSPSDTDSDSDSEVEPAKETVPKAAPQKPAGRSASPTPPPSSVPPFLPPENALWQEQQDEWLLKDRFRKFWMASVADAFKDDLEEIRKEPNMTTSRLEMLIDSLAAGGDVLTASPVGPDSSMTEMEIVLEHNP